MVTLCVVCAVVLLFGIDGYVAYKYLNRSQPYVPDIEN